MAEEKDKAAEAESAQQYDYDATLTTDIRLPRKPKKRRPKARRGARKACRDCHFIDFKDLQVIGKYCTAQGKIQSRKRNGTCSKCQGLIKAAVKRARFMALMPYIG